MVTDAGVVYLSHMENNTIDRIGPELPTAPRDVQGTVHGSVLTVSFRPPIDPGATPITGYQVSTDGGGSWHPVAVSAVGGRLVGTLSGVSGSSLQVLVRALNTSGPSGNSSGVSVTGSAQLPVTGAAVAGTAGIGLVLLVLGIGLVRALSGRQYA